MRTFKFYFIIICAISLATCKRSGTVNGKVTNVFNGKPVEGIAVKISQSAELKPDSKALQLATTNADGSFMINATYNTRVTYDYYISLQPNENYVATNQFSVKDTVSEISKAYLYYTSQYKTLKQDISNIKKTKDNQYFEFNVAPCARLKIVATDTIPKNDNSRVIVTFIDRNLTTGNPIIYSKTTRESSIPGDYILVPTSGTVSISWYVNSENPAYVHTDTLVLTAFTKSTYHIYY